MGSSKITIVTVCYNAEETIGLTLDSVRKVKCEGVQYIVVDGKSTDNTLSIIEKNIDLVDKLISEPDTGIYDAMNKALKYADSNYIVFLNADDEYLGHNFKSYYNLLDSDYDIIYGDVIIDDRPRKAEFKKMCLAMTLNHPATIIKTKIAKRIGYDKSFKISADYLHCLRAKRESSSSIYVDLPLVKMSDGGISVTHADVAVREDNKVRIMVYGLLKGTFLNCCKLMIRFIR